jgi:hypothetical protein
MEELDTQEQEYPLSLFNKILHSIFGTALFIAGLVFANYASRGSHPEAAWIVFSYLTVLSIVPFVTLRLKVTITKHSIIHRSLFSTKELPLAAAKGYRLFSKGFAIEPTSPEYPRIVVGNDMDLAHSTELRQWVQTNFKDLDAEDLQTAQQQLLQDEKFGHSANERQALHNRAKTVAVFYNAVSSTGAFMYIFFESEFSSMLLLLLPVTGIFLLYTHKGLISFFSDSSRSINAAVYIGIGISSFCLLFHSFKYYSILQIQQLCIYAFVIAVIIMLLLYKKGINPLAGVLKTQATMMLATALVYGVGCIREINCGFDRSAAKPHNAVIKKRHTTTGKYGKLYYHFKLGSLGPKLSSTKIEVSSETYHQHAAGDTVIIRLKQGWLQMPWYRIDK